jgi:hypothetical protein
MIVKVEIPELTVYPDGFPRHWLNIVFLGNRADEYKVHAIVTTYVRLVEGAHVYYKQGREFVQRVWIDHSKIGIGAHNLAATHFEHCINMMHRAALCMTRIRGGKDIPADIKSLIPTRPTFMANSITKRLRELRDAIQHMEARVLRGEIAENTPFMLTATGPETPLNDLSQPGQTLKIIDRLTLGGQEVKFEELVAWLLAYRNGPLRREDREL